MANWSHMLMFAESMNTDEDADPKSMKSLEECITEAANNRTPKKAVKIQRERSNFIPIMTPGKKKGIMDQLKVSNNKFGMKTIEHMHDKEEHVTLIES